MKNEPSVKPLPHLTLATRVTLVRILGIPVFILLMTYYNLSLQSRQPVDSYRIASLILFAVIALTDALDGYLARSRGEITPLGKILDPLADKLLLLSAVIVMTRPALAAMHAQLPIWFTLIIISRDALILLGVLVVHHIVGRFEIRPRLCGKIATFLQMVTVVWLLAAVRSPHLVFIWIAGMAAFFTTISGLQYLFDGLRQLEIHHLTAEGIKPGLKAS